MMGFAVDPATAVHYSLVESEPAEAEIDVRVAREPDHVVAGWEDCRKRCSPGTAAAHCMVDSRDGFGFAHCHKRRPYYFLIPLVAVDHACRSGGMSYRSYRYCCCGRVS